MSEPNSGIPAGRNSAEPPSAEHWTARFSSPVIFVILTLIAAGVYLAFAIPVAVFPNTDFPKIVVAIDNGVSPINQMEVTVTRPIEEAMNSVPGLERRVAWPRCSNTSHTISWYWRHGVPVASVDIA